MAMYTLTDHREARARARAAHFRLLGAVVAVTALSMFGPLSSNLGGTYRTVAVGVEDALFHSHSLQ
jgi:hypothetical protein